MTTYDKYYTLDETWNTICKVFVMVVEGREFEILVESSKDYNQYCFEKEISFAPDTYVMCWYHILQNQHILTNEEKIVKYKKNDFCKYTTELFFLVIGFRSPFCGCIVNLPKYTIPLNSYLTNALNFGPGKTPFLLDLIHKVRTSRIIEQSPVSGK